MFKKFPSIENHYLQKNIDYWLRLYPELKDEDYVIMEKLDGANFAIILTNKTINFQRRNDLLKEDESFFNYQETVKRYKSDIKKIQSFLGEQDTLHLYCELIGNKVLNRVKYTNDDLNYLRIIGMSLNDKMISSIDMIALLQLMKLEFNLDDMQNQLFTAPIFGLYKGLEKSLDFDVNRNSPLLNIENNLMEGVIIQPASKVYADKDGAIFAIKKKNEKFFEKEKKIHTQTALINDLEQYVNESRIQSCFSKVGVIQLPNQMAFYIKYIQEDIKQDALKDGIENIDLKLKKIGAKIAIELKKYL